VDTFRAFCAVGDIDPDDGREWKEYPYRGSSPSWIWMSRSKDVVFETSFNPIVDGQCHYFGLTGIADKAIAMYNFMHDHYITFTNDEDEYDSYWEDVTWDRVYC